MENLLLEKSNYIIINKNYKTILLIQNYLKIEIEKIFQCKKCLKIYDDETGKDFKIKRVFRLRKKSKNFHVKLFYLNF